MFTKEHVHKMMVQSKIKERKKMNQKVKHMEKEQ